MIDLVRLDLSDRRIAQSLLKLQRRAYRIEADLIGSDGIPPLRETLDELPKVRRDVPRSDRRR